MDNLPQLNALQATALHGVLSMHLKGWRNCFGITAKQALVNTGVIDSKTKLTKKMVQSFLSQLENQGIGK